MELIRLLRLEGELSRVRAARQKMSELFPLTEGKLWGEGEGEERCLLRASSSSQAVLQIHVWNTGCLPQYYEKHFL